MVVNTTKALKVSTIITFKETDKRLMYFSDNKSQFYIRFQSSNALNPIKLY